MLSLCCFANRLLMADDSEVIMSYFELEKNSANFIVLGNELKLLNILRHFEEENFIAENFLQKAIIILVASKCVEMENFLIKLAFQHFGRFKHNSENFFGHRARRRASIIIIIKKEQRDWYRAFGCCEMTSC